MNQDIHPRLRLRANLLTALLGAIALMLLIATLLIILLFFSLPARQEKPAALLPLFALILLMQAVLLVAFRQVWKRQRARLRLATRIIQEHAPVPMTVIFPDLGTLTGAFAHLCRDTKHGEPEITALVAMEQQRRGAQKPETFPADVYLDADAAADLVVILTEKRALLGRMQPSLDLKPRIERQIRLMMWAIAAGAITIVGVAGFMGYQAAQTKRLARLADETTQWPATEGVITDSSVKESYISKGRGGRVRVFSAEIAYRYTLSGKNYEGNQIHIGYRPTSDVDKAQTWAGAFPPGKPVEVFYAPARPEESVLEPGHAPELRKHARTQTLAAAGIAAIALLLLIFGQRAAAAIRKKADRR